MDRIKELLKLIEEIVDEEGKTWREKQSEIVAACSESDKINLGEFASWFEDL